MHSVYMVGLGAGSKKIGASHYSEDIEFITDAWMISIFKKEILCFENSWGCKFTSFCIVVPFLVIC